MALWSPGQAGQAAAGGAGGRLLWAVVALGAGTLAPRRAARGAGAGCDHARAALYGPVHQRVGARLCDPGGLESVALQPERLVATALERAAGSAARQQSSGLGGAGAGRSWPLCALALPEDRSAGLAPVAAHQSGGQGA